jgi:hypothetical protein
MLLKTLSASVYGIDAQLVQVGWMLGLERWRVSTLPSMLNPNLVFHECCVSKTVHDVVDELGYRCQLGGEPSLS